MTKALVAAAAMFLLLVPMAQAHASPEPLNIEEHLLADDTTDVYAAYDGFDLQDLYVREAFFEDTDGLVFRMVIYGGFSPAKVASQMHLDLDITANGEVKTFRVSSSDGLAWEGDALVLENSLEAESEGGAIAGAIQVFIPLTDLGVGINDTVGPFVWKNYADDDLRDIAPGGAPVPGTNGEVMLPGTSTVQKETITLAGPTGYTVTTAVRSGNNFTLNVENQITPIGQHIMLMLPEPAGWTITPIDTNAKAVEVAEHPVFKFSAIPGEGAEAFEIHILTDLGGHEILTVAPTGTPGPVTPTPSATPDEPAPSKDSPIGFLVGPIALAAAFMLRRR